MSLLLLSGTPARADGHWHFVVTAKGTATRSSSDDGTPPPANPVALNTSVTTDGSGASADFDPYDNVGSNNPQPEPTPHATGYGVSSTVSSNKGGSCSVNVSVTVHVTGTWVGSDPTPPYVWIQQNSKASASGGTAGGINTPSQASDGLGDLPDGYGVSQPLKPQLSKTSNGSIDYTVSLSASDSVTAPAGHFDRSTHLYIPGGGGCGAGVGGYSVSIHATPYAFKLTNASVEPSSNSMSMTYAWKSTTGSLPDLSCTVYEYLTYPGGNPFYLPAPFDSPAKGFPNPANILNDIVASAPGSAGTLPDNHWPPTWSAPLVACPSYIVTQIWDYLDNTTGEVNTLVPGDSGPYTITRSLLPAKANPSQTIASDWTYKCAFTGCGTTLIVVGAYY